MAELSVVKILFIPNWNVAQLTEDQPQLQAPDKKVAGEPYWFFRHFRGEVEVDVLDRGPSGAFQWLEKKAKFYVRQPFHAFFRRKSYDLIFSHGAQSGLVYELLSSFSHHCPPHAMIDVGCLNGGRVNRTETPLIRYALRKGPHIITHNTLQLDFYRQHYPVLARNAQFIPFGVDCDYFTPQPYVASRKMLAFGYAKRDFETLCRAFPTGRGWQLNIVGDTTLSKQYACQDIVFHTAEPLHRLMSLINSCEVVVLPLPELPYSYGQMSLLQSMAMARPVICSLTTSTIDYVSDAPCVQCVTPGDVSAMHNALNQMMQLSKDERAALGQASRQWVEQRFNESVMAQQIEQFIYQII